MPEAPPHLSSACVANAVVSTLALCAGCVDAESFLRGPRHLLAVFVLGTRIEQKLHGLASEIRGLVSIGGEIGEDRQRVRIRLRIHVRLDKLPGLPDRGSLVARVFERPCNVGRNPQDIRVIAIGRAFVDEGRIRLPASIGLLLGGKPLLGPRDQFRIHVVDFGHVAELHQAVSRQDLVRRSLTEPGEPSAGNFKGQQALIPVADVALGFGVHFGSQLVRALHIIERQYVGVCAGRRLLEAAARHAQDRVHAFDHLAQRAGIQPDEDLAGVGDGRRRETNFVLHRRV